MIIFQRMATFEAAPQEVMPWAQELTQAVNERTGLNASLWHVQFGAPIGSLVWSTMADNLTALEAANDALLSDDRYLSLTDKAREWARTAPEDSLLRIVHTSGGEYVRPDVGAYAEVTMAVPAEGKLAKATAFGVDMADVHAELTHSSVLFCTSAYGDFGQLRWMATYDSAAAVDAASETIAKDDDYTKRLDKAGDLFIPGSAQRGLARRIA